MIKCIITIDDELFIHVDPSCIPTTEFVRKRLQEYCQDAFNGDMVSAPKTIMEDGEFCLIFTPAGYIPLVDILDSHLNYNLSQARTIIQWIDNYVRNPDDDSTDWATTYLEILEGADSE